MFYLLKHLEKRKSTLCFIPKVRLILQPMVYLPHVYYIMNFFLCQVYSKNIKISTTTNNIKSVDKNDVQVYTPKHKRNVEKLDT